MHDDYIILTSENCEFFALKHYTNPACRGKDEFHEDLNDRPKWIKRLLKKFDTQNTIRVILVKNHIIGFFNTFGVEAGTQLLFYKIDPELHVYLKTIMSTLEMYDPTIVINGKQIGEIESSTTILSIIQAEKDDYK